MSTNLLNGKVQAAVSGLNGFDCDAVLSSTQASDLKKLGYDFCIRYLSLSTPQQPGDLTTAEANDILNSGLALMAVQHVQDPGWLPGESVGTELGTVAALNAQSVGLPAGMNIWCDLEGLTAGTSTQLVIDYCNAWYTAVQAAGYVPGIYVGAGCILDGEQLYDLAFQHYWKSMSDVPDIPYRGYQMVQKDTITVLDDLQIDPDTTQTDEEGGTVLWLVQS